MAEILHQLIGSLSHYLQGSIHPRWCRISAINSMAPFWVELWAPTGSGPSCIEAIRTEVTRVTRESLKHCLPQLFFFFFYQASPQKGITRNRKWNLTNMSEDIITMGSILPFDVPWHVVSFALETMSFTGGCDVWELNRAVDGLGAYVCIWRYIGACLNPVPVGK